ncbi:MAG TPA: radical SAM protein [Ruminiclostridium sp.]|nr:radical SAM protein [Clostridiaceae bacterium]HAA25562.1 radical SAM protein [Ruminiclostridium sp.]
MPEGNHVPGYIELLESGELDNRIKILKKKLKECIICPHHCKVDRTGNKRGFCRAGADAVIDGYGPHYGEESVLVGRGGSGTIFFSYCTLQCVFCQNYRISHCGDGYEVTPQELARIMLQLQDKGCHNINLVSPTHFVPQIIEAVGIAARGGLKLPLVYNTGGYDDIDTLKLLDGIIDIYMPDIKFGDNAKAKKYTKADKYFDIAKAAVKEMHRQVGVLNTDEKGIAYKGLLVRHLVMPDNAADTYKVLEFIADEVSKDTFVNIMSQYYPAHKSYSFAELSRRISRDEYIAAVKYAEELGFANIMKY